MLTELRGGLTVRTEAIALIIALEARHHRLTATDGVLTVTNGSALTASDRAAIRAEKAHLLALASYCAELP